MWNLSEGGFDAGEWTGGRERNAGCGGTKTYIRSPSQESIEELVSPSMEGPAGAGPVAIRVEDKRWCSRYIWGEGGEKVGEEGDGETGDGGGRRPRGGERADRMSEGRSGK